MCSPVNDAVVPQNRHLGPGTGFLRLRVATGVPLQSIGSDLDCRFAKGDHRNRIRQGVLWAYLRISPVDADLIPWLDEVSFLQPGDDRRLQRRSTSTSTNERVRSGQCNTGAYPASRT